MIRPEETALLQAKRLRIQFGGLIAVKDVDFQIGPREICGLIGPNGSGKTTFFNLVTGVCHPSEGEIQLQGRDITRSSPFEIACQGIARTFQNSRLCLDLSVLDNVLIGMLRNQKANWLDAVLRSGFVRAEMSRCIVSALELLSYFSKSLPDERFKRVRDLPQADRRKVEICRALASDPRLLLLDEPSAGMTPEETVELMDDIRRVREKRKEISIVIIEHDMMVIRGVTERVVVFNHGEKIAEGPFAAISADTRVREAYLGIGT